MRKTVILIVALTFFVGGVCVQNGFSADYPQKTVEFVVPASAGGGSDTLARLILDIIQKNNLVDGTIVVVNKPGGASAAGHAYIQGSRNGDHIIFTMNAAHALAARSNPAIDSEAFTPIANLAMDNVLLVAKADGPYKTFAEALQAIKANPQSISVGVADNLDKLCVAQVNSETGSEFSDVYFDGAGEIATALLGGHIQLGIFNPNECLGHIKAGTMIPLATFSTERLAAPLADVPTFKELGFPGVEFQMFRSIMGGKGMSPDVQNYWSDVIEKVVATDQWNENYIQKKGLEAKFMPAAQYAPYHHKTAERLYQAGKKIGMFE